MRALQAAVIAREHTEPPPPSDLPPPETQSAPGGGQALHLCMQMHANCTNTVPWVPGRSAGERAPAPCRALGGLLSAHIATLNNPALVPEYAGTFLHKAEDLARRLMPAFDTSTGIPISWVNLRSGKVDGHEQDTCVACTTTLAIEFRMLSVLTGNATYGDKVDAAVREIFSRRHPGTGFVGNSIRTDTGAWHRTDAGIGPGIDSYYEYLLKMYLIFGDEQYLNMFVDQFVRVQQQATTPGPWGGFEWVLDVGMHGGGARTQYIASLTAFWPGLQVRPRRTCMRPVAWYTVARRAAASAAAAPRLHAYSAERQRRARGWRTCRRRVRARPLCPRSAPSLASAVCPPPSPQRSPSSGRGAACACMHHERAETVASRAARPRRTAAADTAGGAFAAYAGAGPIRRWCCWGSA